MKSAYTTVEQQPIPAKEREIVFQLIMTHVLSKEANLPIACQVYSKALVSQVQEYILDAKYSAEIDSIFSQVKQVVAMASVPAAMPPDSSATIIEKRLTTGN